MMGKKKKIALVSSHGGHLTEMNAIKDIFENDETFLVTYDGVTPSKLDRTYLIKIDWFRNPLSLATETIKIFGIFRKERPDVIFSTGAEIALPLFFIGKYFFGCKLVYLECSAQVNTPSTTGRIVYKIADLFLVQWESLLKCYGDKAKCYGGLI